MKTKKTKKTKKTARPKQAEISRRGAAAMANATRGMSRCLTPNKRAYDRKQGKGVSHE